MMLKHRLLPLFLVVVPFFISSCEFREGMIKQLKGQWRFSIGDNKNWANLDFDDSHWDKIYVPSEWEDQGYNDYNGFAWYRKTVRIQKKYSQSSLYLYLGRIDDADEVYFNGVRIGGTGTLPPDFSSAYNTKRRYFIPQNLVKYNGDNLIAVRVYDGRDGGGIRSGDLGIYTYNVSPVDYDLSGDWKFTTGDSLAWKDPDFTDKPWATIKVPGYYEDQGFPGYDGFSWYRKKFDVTPELRDKKLVMVLGKIDDIDEVYINGRFIGGTGIFFSTKDSIDTYSYYDENRGYYLPDDMVLKDKDNVIAVRVYDSGDGGGIYSGHIGIISQDNYVKYWESRKSERRWH
jgi:sialate O-acetylesterase